MGDRIKNYTLGNGTVMFKADGEDNFRSLGNAPDFKVGMKVEKKEHYSSETDVPLKDAEVITKTESTGSFTLDEPNIQNLTRYFLGDAATSSSQTSGTVTATDVSAVHDAYVQLNKIEISNVVVKNTAGTTTYAEGADYTVVKGQGLLMALSTGAITDNQALKVGYDYAAVTVQSGNAALTPSLKGHLWFVGNPSKGEKIDIKGYVSLTPNGTIDMIGADWMKMQIDFDFMTHPDYPGLFKYSTRGLKA
ncbi:MAG: hypothetical protein L7F77_09225 [Candidatus Magnetominusculus sp. LBB02]|nr:hypothetical protein [Candidatus Magnetominusculus sp. LBB02]